MAEYSIIKGILINVKDRKIEEIEFENSLKGVYEKLDCDCVTTVPYPFDEKHEIIVDDESLLKPLQNFFTFNSEDIEESYCGNGLIVSWDDDGNWQSHNLNLEEVLRRLSFLRYYRTSEGVVSVILKENF